MSDNKHNSVSIPHAILGMILTVLLSIGTTYATIHVTQSKVERNEKDIQELKNENKKRDDQYVQILENLSYIRAKLDMEEKAKGKE